MNWSQKLGKYKKTISGEEGHGRKITIYKYYEV